MSVLERVNVALSTDAASELKLSVIIPVYNECDTIEEILLDVQKLHGKLPKHYIEGPQICTQAKELKPELRRLIERLLG